MTYALVESGPDRAVLRCPGCGLEAVIQSQPGLDREKIAKALREVRGCECPIGEGGTAAVIPGMMVYRLSDGKKFQVHDVQPRHQQIKCIDSNDCLTNWMDVRLFTKKPMGLGFSQALERKLNGL
jgi:hypothetical protein